MESQTIVEMKIENEIDITFRFRKQKKLPLFQLNTLWGEFCSLLGIFELH